MHPSEGAANYTRGRHSRLSFFMPLSEVERIAEISHVGRGNAPLVQGFQRREIRTHVRGIMRHLDEGKALLPNAIVLALSPEVRFVRARGPVQSGVPQNVDAGVLNIPIRPEGQRGAWVIDGRVAFALGERNARSLPVRVIGFVSNDINVMRDQFILVNEARPLPTRLIQELLPETGELISPRPLSARKIPSQLCDLLNRDPGSPFYKLIKRISAPDSASAVVSDTAIVTMIRNSINNPLGALARFRTSDEGAPHIQSMYRILTTYWSAVKDVFKEAWGLPPNTSRLMHSTGIQSMGVLMDRIYLRRAGKRNEHQAIRDDLQKMSSACHWTEGEWEGLGLAWNEIQNLHKDIRRLSDELVYIYTVRAAR